jgi:uncharacterized membrane protein
MQEQNYKNHLRYVPAYHFLASGALLAVLVGSIVNLVTSSKDNLYSASLILALTLILVVVWFYARRFATKVQDRAIRAEENFRHYLLTGKPIDRGLRMSQIVALRFASDEEFPALAQRAVAEGLSNKQIKQAVKLWKADHHRA